MQKTYFAIIVIIVFSISKIYGQKNDEIVIGNIYTIHSVILNQDRDVFIHLPDGYDDCVSHYPVIYVMDGENTFKSLSGLIDLNAWLRTIPEMIVVGIPNIDRYNDFMPVIDTIPTSGNADKFVSFFNEELFPFIQENYRTDSFKILYGHSYLGMFTIHCFKNYPETFNAYIAGSPSLKYNINKLCADETPIKKLERNTFLHISIGELESQEYIDNINRFTSYLETQEIDNLKWESYVVNGATHATNLPFSFSYGLNYIFSDWVKIQQVIYEGMDSIEKHFAKLSDQYGYTVKVPEDIFQLLGVYCLENNRIEMSIEIFEKYTFSYNTSYTAYNYLGKALFAKNEIKKAEENFKKALELKPDYNEAKENLDKIKEQKE